MLQTWKNFEDIMLNDISQTQKDKYCINPLIYSTQSSQICRDGTKNGDCHGEKEEMESQCLMSTEFQFGKMKVLEMYGGDGCTTI